MTEIQIKQTGLLSVNTLIVPVCDNKVFIVDPAACSISGDSFSFLNFLKTNNLECIGIVLTHSHFDHITGLFELKEIFPNAKIAIHKDEASEIQAELGPMNQSILQNFGMSSLIPFFNQFVNPEILLQDKNNLSVFAQSTDKKLFSELKKWIVIHTPGHSPGSICLYNEEKRVLISGDTLFYGTCGRTDMYGGNQRTIEASLAKLDKIIPNGTKVYPGHDCCFTK
ncbi:MAG: MBL fold metallo-hydrolase [Treponema sp.]|nr:MBL fold metallo-hydrolase [Treponema sp.]